MVESGEASGPGLVSRLKPAPSFESAGGRLRFTVELRSNETTIVSWKKLLREANSDKHDGPSLSVPVPSLEAHEPPIPQALPNTAPIPSISSKKPAENDAKDSQAQAGSNRLGNVIERIERMYAGNSTDEEDVVLDDKPDDDEYDTEDSFIDDAELDDYFQVDNSAIKHDGFFVNRGKLERLEPSLPASQQPKKRRRKNMTKDHGESDDGLSLNKRVKIGYKDRKASSLIERNSSSQLHRMSFPTSNNEKVKVQASSQNAEVSLNKKSSDNKATVNSSRLSNGDFIRQNKDIDQQRTLVPSLKNLKNKKESTELQNASTQRTNYKGSHLNKSHSGNKLNDANELDQTSEQKEKGGHVEFDHNVPASMERLPIPKVPVIQRKDGSNIRPKSSMLEKAIRELEKTVAESRPPSAEVQDPDNSSQGAKRRLPPEIKQKLAKVARFAQASYGKIPKDVINRLMSIVGHLMQLTTLKRNLKAMTIMGLSAKQEKDDEVQKIKQEVTEMVNLQIPYMDSQSGQQAVNSDDFQDAGPEEKEASNQRYTMDDVLEDKICDLYDLYVERLEEHSGPSIRKLYEELAALWPRGVVDTAGIKRAICRAKDRRKALRNQQQDKEKIKKRKVLTSKADDTTRGDDIRIHQASTIHDLDSRGQGSTLASKPVPSAADAFANGPNIDKPKQEKSKGSSSSNFVIALPMDTLPKKKKVRRKLNVEVVSQGEEGQKKHKNVAKSTLQPAAPPET